MKLIIDGHFDIMSQSHLGKMILVIIVLVSVEMGYFFPISSQIPTKRELQP